MAMAHTCLKSYWSKPSGHRTILPPPISNVLFFPSTSGSSFNYWELDMQAGGDPGWFSQRVFFVGVCLTSHPTLATFWMTYVTLILVGGPMNQGVIDF